jgi:alanyl-tRNA synthetase
MILEAAPTLGETKIVVGHLPANTDIEAVRTQIDRIRQKCGSAFVAFGWTGDGGKVPLVVALTSDLVKKGLKAGDIVKQAAALIGGSGGGKPDYAQAGGKDATKLPDALKKAEELVRATLDRV